MKRFIFFSFYLFFSSPVFAVGFLLQQGFPLFRSSVTVPVPEVDNDTGALERWNFTTVVTSNANNGDVYSTHTANVDSSILISTCINGTQGIEVITSTGSATVPIKDANDTYLSPHVGSSGMMAWSMWVYPKRLNSTGQVLFNKRAAGAYEYQAYFNLATVHLDLQDTAGNASSFDSTSCINVNAWNHILVGVDKTQGLGNIFYCFVNNNPMTLTVTDNNLSTGFTQTPLYFGRGESENARCDGCMFDKIKFFPYRISTSMENTLFNERSSPLP